MSVWTAIKGPLQGRTPLARVFWIYGLVGSLVVSGLGLFIDPGNVFMTEAYALLGLVFTVYVTVATYKCAGNCESKAITRIVRVSTLVSVIIFVPLFAYLYFSGALNVIVGTLGEQ